MDNLTLKQTILNVLVTLNSSYVEQLIVMLTSLIFSNPGISFIVYIMYSSMTERDFAFINRYIEKSNCSIIRIRVPEHLFSNLPITRRYPQEMYYRIFAAQFLPKELDRVLYLDPDLVVINPLDKLYSIDFRGNLFAAAPHISEFIEKLNRIRLKMPKNSTYINSGVMMLNLSLLRQQNIREIFDYMKKYRNFLFLPDQDAINGVYCGKILTIDPKIYNLSDRYYILHNLRPKNKNCKINLDWIQRNTVIIHYYGKNKPWKNNYKGKLGYYYKRFEYLTQQKNKKFQEAAK